MRRTLCLILLASTSLALAAPSGPRDRSRPGSRSVMDAHNCYPYYEWWYNRIDRALSAGTPLAIEQDLYWYTDPKTGESWSVVAHGVPVSGHEPTMEHYFFDRVRPIVEQALKDGNHGNWPLITLNLDLKTEEPAHLHAIWALLSKYQDWLSTAPKTNDPARVQPLTIRPIVVLTGESDAQQAVFYDEVPVGDRLLVFGAVHTHTENPMAAPEVLEPEPASNYRRWWNNPWDVVEAGGQQHAGAWTEATIGASVPSSSTPITTASGFASTRWTARRNRKRAAMAGSTATTSAHSPRPKLAGAPRSRPAWITSPAISTSCSAPSCAAPRAQPARNPPPSAIQSPPAAPQPPLPDKRKGIRNFVRIPSVF